MILLQAAISGLLVGGLYALMAVGMSLTWGMLKVINLAHFGLILLSSYLTFELATSLGIDPLLTVVITGPLMFVLAGALQWGLQARNVSEFNSLLITFGLLIAIVQVVTNQWSADFRRMTAEVNPYATESVTLGQLVFPLPTLMAFIVALLVVLVGYLVLQRTYPGRALRAFAQDRAIASAFGIDHARLGIVLAGCAGVTAALAGMLFAVDRTLTPTSAFEWIGIVFAVVIVGGIGNIAGTLVAGSLLMMLAALVSLYSPAATPVVVFSAIVVALLFRPNGLFARTAG
jgi:branched-chain amino acid transport system permease protein